MCFNLNSLTLIFSKSLNLKVTELCEDNIFLNGFQKFLDSTFSFKLQIKFLVTKLLIII